MHLRTGESIGVYQYQYIGLSGIGRPELSFWGRRLRFSLVFLLGVLASIAVNGQDHSEAVQDSTLVVKLCNDALKQASVIIESVGVQNIYPEDIKLLDNGRKIEARDLKYINLAEELKIQNQIFAKIHKMNPGLQVASVDVEFSYSVSLERQVPVELLKVNTARIGIQCTGSSSIVKEMLTKVRSPHTISENKEIVIYLVFEDEKWHWNPVGW